MSSDQAAPGEASNAHGLVEHRSPYAFADTLARLRTALEHGGFRIFAEIDHCEAAHSVGLEMRPTTVLIYGNPRGGTPLMVAMPDFALELPLRLLIRENEAGDTLVIHRASAAFEQREGLSPALAEKLAPAEHLIARALTGDAGAAITDANASATGGT
jgi:uncharacterized protein (DUF302 family)